MITSGLAKFHDSLEPLMVDIRDIAPAPYNYNNGDVDAIRDSIVANGVYRPVFVQKSSGDIIAGNHTYAACMELGATQMPVVYLDVDDFHARRIMVADNRTAALAQPDNALLLQILQELDSGDTIKGTGYTEADLDVLKHLAEIPLDSADFAQWPTFSVQLPPNVLSGFLDLTHEAHTDREKFELLLRMAGWGA